MAEEESELELDRFKKELQSLVNGSASEEHGLRSGNFCARFCELVEDHTSRWQVPLPQLQVLRSALCAFVQGAASFPSDCEHVRYTLSSLALSVFELLLFFGKDEFPEDPLKDILDSFQECHSSLVRYQNVYLLQVRQIIKDGGPWASSVLHGILKELEQPQEEVDRYLSSEVSVFFELRVRYLIACERNQEALALAQRCNQHPTAGKHLFFKQAYLSCLRRTSQQERLFKEMAEIDAKDAVEILCIAENEEKDEFVLELSRGFLLQQLRSGDMYYLWDLVFIWCKLCLRVKASKQDFLKECKEMILSAANVKAMFPFMKVILEEELGRDGLTFCVELCASALQTDLKNDPDTKSLIYKTIAYLLPSDLEICRACALLVFFLERTVEAYKTVFLLYTHPDQEYHLDCSPIGNHVRFEVIQILKKGLFFDPEFWNLLNIKTNCLKLMSDNVAKAALCEIMEEDKWVPNYCARGLCRCHVEPERNFIRPVAKPVSTNRQESGTEDRRVRTLDESYKSLPSKKRGRKPGSQITKDLEPFPVRRSFRQLDLAQNHARQLSSRRQRFLTRQEDMRTLRRRGRKPRWLLEELAAQAENSAPREGKKPGRKPKQYKDIAVDSPVLEITMELSYPDNEVALPADVQCRSTLTSATFDQSKSHSCESPPKLCVETPNSQCPLLSEQSSLWWREKAMATEEVFVFQAQESITFVKKFHCYAKVPEDEGISRICALDDNEVASAPPVLEKERPLEAPAPSENRHHNEPPKFNDMFETKVSSLTHAVAQDASAPLGGTVDTNELPVLEKYPCQKSLSVMGIPDIVVQNGTSGPSGDEATNIEVDTMPTLESALEIAADKFYSSDNTLNRASDSICPIESVLEKAADNVSVCGNRSETTANTTPSITTSQIKADTKSIEKGTSGKDNASSDPRGVGSTLVSKNAAVIASSPKTQNKKPQETVERKAGRGKRLYNRTPSVTGVHNSSAPVHRPQPEEVLHKCRLCNKECVNCMAILSHAFLHYRLEKRCMFCLAVSGLGRPLGHFKKHIKQLRELKESVEEKECIGSPELSAKTDTTVQEAVQSPKKARPGLAQIKSKLLMRLNFRREATAQKTENSNDDRNLLKSSFTKKLVPAPEPKDEENKMESDEEHTAEKKIIYLTRGLVKKSKSKSKSKSKERYLRKRLARKAKTITSMEEKDDTITGDGSAHRLNGFMWKKLNVPKMKQVQGDSNHATEKNVRVTTKQENKEQMTEKLRSKEKAERNEAKHDGSTKRDKTISSSAVSKRKFEKLQKSEIEKKKTRLADQREDAAQKKEATQKENAVQKKDAKQKENAVQKKDANQKENAVQKKDTDQKENSVQKKDTDQKDGAVQKKDTDQKENTSQKKDAKMIKKRKLNITKSEENQNKTNDTDKPTEEQEDVRVIEAVVNDITKEENGTQSDSNETYQPVHVMKKQLKAPAMVKCPREPCTFQGRAGPVLSHVLIHHPTDLKALEFFYNFAKQKCIFCNRRIWTPQHFFDHVVSHRGNLKHLCYHIDCKQRFKTRLDLTEHMIKDHNPLNVVCSFSGCTMQFSNPKILYSHEREHYKGFWRNPLTKNVVPADRSDDQSSSPPDPSPKTSTEGIEICATNPEMPSLQGTEQDRNIAPAIVEDEMPLTLNKGSVSYTKNLKLVNGHSDHEQVSPVKPPQQPQKEQEAENKAVSTKPFVRPPPSAYLDELYISMPKRWKGPQVSSRGSVEIVEPSVKRQVCPRCSASFNNEEELQGHREKCTSLFGFDSDDEGGS